MQPAGGGISAPASKGVGAVAHPAATMAATRINVMVAAFIA